MVPTSLHASKVASKKLQSVNVQFRNAASRWIDALNRHSRNVHSMNELPLFATSLRSTSTKATFAWVAADRSLPPQSS
jgi:hypothetical protein